MSECTHDCSSCSSNCSEAQPQSLIASPHKGSSIKKVIGVVSGKGGVGKSMVTDLLAVAFSRKGYHCAIMDADITGPSIPKAFGLTQKAEGTQDTIYPVKTKTGIDVMSINLLWENETDPVIWRGPVIAGAVKQFWTDVLWEDVDYMFVDMPPGTGDVPLTVFQSLPINGILIVSTPQSLVSMIVDKAMNMAQMMQVPVLGMVENMRFLRCPDCGKEIPLFGSDDHVDSHAVPVLERIPLDPTVAAACDAGKLEQAEIDYLAKTAVMLTETFGKKQ